MLSVIGTAGRGKMVGREIYDLAYESFKSSVAKLKADTICSGGAAVMDHLAIRGYLEDLYPNLVLHLPAEMTDSGFAGANRSHGSIANYWHKQFSVWYGADSLKEIRSAINKGAEVTISNGFFARNLLVGQCDQLLAFTFGTHSSFNSKKDPGWSDSSIAGLLDGGTAHCWRNSTAPLKKHVAIHDLCLAG